MSYPCHDTRYFIAGAVGISLVALDTINALAPE